MAEALDATLVETCISRLVIDCNRDLAVPTSIVEISEHTEVPANRQLGQTLGKINLRAVTQRFRDVTIQLLDRIDSNDAEHLLLIGRGMGRVAHSSILFLFLVFSFVLFFLILIGFLVPNFATTPDTASI